MILWVDDDIYAALRPWADDLNDSGLTVTPCKTVDDMWGILNDKKDIIDCIIMDIILPTGKSVDPREAKNGGITGWIILKQLKENIIYSHIPIIIFTIVKEPKVMEWALGNKIRFLRKQETSPSQLTAAVRAALSAGESA